MKKINKIIHKMEEEYSVSENVIRKSDPLDILIATILSQNTNDKLSYIAFTNLKNNFNSWDDVLDSNISKLRAAINVCGLGNRKSIVIRNILRSLRKKYGLINLDYIKDKSDEEIYSELLEYKGIGNKTVSCVLLFSMGRDAFPVDTHIHRIANRLGLVNTNSPDKSFQILKNIIPSDKKAQLHVDLIRFGRNICKANKPLCNECFLFEQCSYEHKKYYSSINKSKNILKKENNFIILENV